MAEEPELAGLERSFKAFEEQPAIEPRKHMDRLRPTGIGDVRENITIDRH